MCEPCRPGTYSTDNNAANCDGIGCDANSYGPDGQTSQAAAKCTPCLAGFAPNQKQTECTCAVPCPPGLYGNQPNCLGCPAGTFQSVAGARNITDCTLCPTGRHSNKINATSIVMCTKCPAGKHGSAQDGGGSTSQGSACELCTPGSFSIGGAATCSSCPSGRFGTTGGLESADCSGICPLGWNCPRGTAAPEPCGEDTFSTVVVTIDATCKACPAHALCAGADSVVNLPGFWPLYDYKRPHELMMCVARFAKVPCFQSCLSAEACIGAVGLSNTNESSNATTMPTWREWLVRYDGLSSAQLPGSNNRTSSSWEPRQCRDGYEGLLCGNCTTSGNATFVRDGSKCRKCPAPVFAWLAMVVAMLALGIIGVFLVHKTVNKKIQGGVTQDDIDASANKRDILLPILRQLLSFCTLLGKVGSFQVGSIKAFRTVMHTASEVSSGVGVGSFWVTCAVQWSFYQRFIVVATLPAAIVLLCIFGVRVGFFRSSWRDIFRVWTTATANLDDPRERRIRCFLDASVIYCLYIAFPTVTQQLFHTLKCTDINLVADGGKRSASYLTADFRVSCGKDNAAFGVVFAVGVALVLLYVEKFSKSECHTSMRDVYV